VKGLDAPGEKVTDVRVKGGVIADRGLRNADSQNADSQSAIRNPQSAMSTFLVNHNADVALVTLRYRFKDAAIDAAEEPFDAAGRKFARGSFIVKNVSSADMQAAAADLGLQVTAVPLAPSVKTHTVRAALVA